MHNRVLQIVILILMGNIYNKVLESKIEMRRPNVQQMNARNKLKPKEFNEVKDKHHIGIPNIKKVEKLQILHQPQQIKIPQLSTQQIIDKIQSIVKEMKGFDETWSLLQSTLAGMIKFKLIFPEAVSPKGEELMKNGCFIIYWIKIISEQEFINMNIIYKSIEEKYLPKITKHYQYLKLFLKQRLEIQKQKAGPEKTDEKLKRADIKGVQTKQLSSADMKKNIIDTQGYLLDYFQINDIYLANQVQIVGLVKKYDNKYAIYQIRPLGSSKEITCIALLVKGLVNHSADTLKQIERNYENLSYLQINEII